MIGSASSDQRSGSVEKHDIATGGFFSREHITDQRSIQRRVSAGDVVESGSGQAAFFGRYFVAVDTAVAHFSTRVGPVIVTSSSPSPPWTTSARRSPSMLSASASFSTRSSE